MVGKQLAVLLLVVILVVALEVVQKVLGDGRHCGVWRGALCASPRYWAVKLRMWLQSRAGCW